MYYLCCFLKPLPQGEVGTLLNSSCSCLRCLRSHFSWFSGLFDISPFSAATLRFKNPLPVDTYLRKLKTCFHTQLHTKVRSSLIHSNKILATTPTPVDEWTVKVQDTGTPDTTQPRKGTDRGHASIPHEFPEDGARRKSHPQKLPDYRIPFL